MKRTHPIPTAHLRACRRPVPQTATLFSDPVLAKRLPVRVPPTARKELEHVAMPWPSDTIGHATVFECGRVTGDLVKIKYLGRICGKKAFISPDALPLVSGCYTTVFAVTEKIVKT